MPKLNESEGGKVKPAGYKQEYTKENIVEILKCRKDPIYFVKKYVYIEHPTKGRMLFDLFDFQESLITTYNSYNRVIAMLSRQCGKTITAAAYLLWWAIFKDNQTILVASKDADGAKEIMDRLWFAYEELPWWIKPGTKIDQVHQKVFDNHSKIRATATTKTSGRGKSNSLVYLDEFAFVRPGIANDFWTAIFPSLATGGKCIITSTPNTDEDKFSQIWFNAEMAPLSDEWHDPYADRSKSPSGGKEEDYETFFENEDVKREFELKDGIVAKDSESEDDGTADDFVAFHAHWTRVPDSKGGYRGEKFKREAMASGISHPEWTREFECAFVSGDSTLISGSKLATLRRDIRKPKFVDRWGCRWYEEIRPNVAYGVVLDPSEGVGLDDACIQVWEIPSLRQVAEWNSNSADQTEQTKMLRRVLKRLFHMQQDHPDHMGDCNIYYSVERNGLGIGILQTIEYEDETTFPGFLIDSTMTSSNARGAGSGQERPNKWRGLITSVSTKKRYAVEFKNLVEQNLFVVRSKFLASQMKTFVKKGQSYAAKEGSKDDIVMSAVLLCHLIDEVRYHEPDLDDLIRPDLDDYDPNDMEHPDNMAMPPII